VLFGVFILSFYTFGIKLLLIIMHLQPRFILYSVRINIYVYLLLLIALYIIYHNYAYFSSFLSVVWYVHIYIF